MGAAKGDGESDAVTGFEVAGVAIQSFQNIRDSNGAVEMTGTVEENFGPSTLGMHDDARDCSKQRGVRLQGGLVFVVEHSVRLRAAATGTGHDCAVVR